MKVIVPMAGRGSRFADKGFQTPKPLIEVNGQPMVLRALKSIEEMEVSEIIFVLLRDHEEHFQASELIRRHVCHPLSFIYLDEITEGQLCTVMAAKEKFEGKEDLLIIASDTYVESSLATDIRQNRSHCAGLISVMNMPGDRWSFVKTDAGGKAVEVAEKNRISDLASTGIYYFSNGKQFLRYASEIIDNHEKTRGEYYVIPVYQKMINDGLTIKVSHATSMWDMGTPEVKKAYENYLKGIG